MREKIFYFVCFGFAGGVFLRSFWRVDFYPFLFIGLIVLFFFLISRRKPGIFISIFLLAFSLGILRFYLADAPLPPIFETHVGQSVSVSGEIVEEPAKNESGVKLTIKAQKEKENAGIVLFMKSNGGYRYGDGIKVTGILEKPKNFMTDQGLEFDYANYLRKDGIFYVMRDPKIEVLSSGHGSFIKRMLFSAKERFNAAISSAIPAPESIVMEGIILGERSAFSQSLRQSFMDTGTIHIVTIGGYHVTLVAQWIMKILEFLPRHLAAGTGILSVFLYIIVTGGAQTTIRAGIMATLALLAGMTGRMYEAGRALILAAAVMILINPYVLVYDVSFELSFMATIAIIFLSPRIEKYFQWIPWKWLRDITAITSSMYIFALPIVLYRMGSLSLVALPANIAIVPIMPVSMIMGFLTGFAGLVSPMLAYIPGKIAYALLHYQVTAIGILAHLPYASLTIQNFPLALVVIIYVIFFWIFFKGSNSRFFVLILPLILTLAASGFLYYNHYESGQNAQVRLQELLGATATSETADGFLPDERIMSSGCEARGPLPDHACTPGAIFETATVEQICVAGYTKTVRNVSTNTRKQAFAEYGITYPQPRGAYEVDHLIPLALGGSNDTANLWPEAAEPAPGFHEKDIVEVFLQQEVCGGRVELSAAQRQAATNWLAVYKNMTFEKILTIRKKYGGQANQ